MESCIFFLYSFCLVYLQFLQVSRYLNCKSILISLGSWYMCEPIGFSPNVAHKWTKFLHKLKCYQSTHFLERLLPVIYNKHVWPVKKIQYFNTSSNMIVSVKISLVPSYNLNSKMINLLLSL